VEADDLIVKKKFETHFKKDFKVFCLFGEAISLPSSKPYTLLLKVGPYTISSRNPKSNKNRSCVYYSKHEQEWVDSLESINDFSNIFIYLMDGDEPVCFRRDSIRNFMDPKIPTKWMEFEPDRAVGKVYKAYKSGFFSMKLYICDVSTVSEFDQNQDLCPAWRNMPKNSI
jgi:hypothetical protein